MPPMLRFASRFTLLTLLLLISAQQVACGPKNTEEAEQKKDVSWLTANPTGESIAALGRLADTDEKALAVLNARADTDENVYIAAWTAVTRNAAWGSTMLRSALGDPSRAELAARALPRKDARLVPFIGDLENAVVRLAAGKRGAVIAGILASIGPPAHSVVERRLIDAKTRGIMCDGIALPEASGDAKSTLLAVPVEARDNPSCVTTVMEMATTEDVVVGWLATGAEPGLLGVAAKSSLPCPRLAAIWKKALAERATEHQPAMTVPLSRSINRCTSILDPVLADLLTKSPRARATIISAIDPFGADLQLMKETCTALRSGVAGGESAGIRERADNAISRSCTFAK
jgi:hypothetical protein